MPKNEYPTDFPIKMDVYIIFAVDDIKVFKSTRKSNIIFAVDDIKVFKSTRKSNIIFAVDDIKVFKSTRKSNIIFAVDDIKGFKSPPIKQYPTDFPIQMDANECGYNICCGRYKGV